MDICCYKIDIISEETVKGMVMNLDQLVDQIRNSPDMMRIYILEIEPKKRNTACFLLNCVRNYEMH